MTGYITPQSASSPITANLRKDELVSLQSSDNETTRQQRVVQIGGSVPVVFGIYKPETLSGGVWLTPPAARYGIQYDEAGEDSFSFGLIISDGEVPSIAIEDVYKGAFSCNDLISPAVVTTYNGLEVTGFDYTLSYTPSGGSTSFPGGYTLSSINTVVPSSTSIQFGNVGIPSWGGTFMQRQSASAGQTVDILFGTNIGVVNYAEIGVEDSSGNPVTTSVEFYIGATLIETVTTLTSNLYVATVVGAQMTPGMGGFRFVVTTPVAATVYYRFSYTSWLYTPPTILAPGTPDVNSTLALFPGSGGSFSGLTTLAVTGAYATGVEQSYPPQQVRCFIRNGLIVDKVLGGSGSSDNFADLAYYFLIKTGSVTSQLIDLTSFQAAARFLAAVSLPFNGVVANSVNLRDYLTRLAPYYLLRFVQAGGKYMLKPLLPLDADDKIETGAITPAATFNNANIVSGSYNKEYISADEFKPFCALMSWRSQSSASFPVQNITEVRFAGEAVDGPYEQYDMEEFCTDARHAEAIGRYIISSRKYTRHRVGFQTTAQSAGLVPTDIVEVDWSYESQGVVQTTSDLYQIDSITEDQQGVYRIEATHFPTDASGSSLVALDVAQLIQVDLPSLEKVLISSGFSFEDTEAQFGVFGSDVRSTDQAFEGNKSAKTAFAYPDIKFTDAFPDPEAMYYMWSWRSYNSGSFQYHTFFGIRDVLNGAGFDIRTASTANVLFFGSSGPQVIGTDTSVQNTWNHYYIQIHWVDGNQQRPEISLWINGALVGNVTISASTPYSPPAGTNAALGDFRVARGSNTIGGTKYYDFCLGGTADNPLVPMNQSTIVPADIESALEAAIPGGLTPPPAKVFRFNPYGDPANVGEWDYLFTGTPLFESRVQINFEDADGLDVDTELLPITNTTVQWWFSVDGRSYEPKTVTIQRNSVGGYYILRNANVSDPRQGELLVSLGEQPRPAPASIYQWDNYGNETVANGWNYEETRIPVGGPVSVWRDSLLFNFIDSNLENIDDYLLGRTSSVVDVWISTDGDPFQQYQTKSIGRNSTDSRYRFDFDAFALIGLSLAGSLQLSFSDPGP